MWPQNIHNPNVRVFPGLADDSYMVHGESDGQLLKTLFPYHSYAMANTHNFGWTGYSGGAAGRVRMLCLQMAQMVRGQ